MSQTYLGVRDARYQGLMEVYKKAYPDKAFLTMQADVKKIWKEELDKGKDEKLFNDKMVELNAKIKRGSLLTFFKSASKPKPKETPKPKEPEPEPISAEPEEDQCEEEKDDKRKETKAQDMVKKQIEVKDRKLKYLHDERAVNQNQGRERSLNEDIKKTKLEIEQLNKNLKRMQNVQKAVQKNRQRKKAFEERLKVENPELAKAMKLRDGPGRPTIETDDPGIFCSCFFKICF